MITFCEIGKRESDRSLRGYLIEVAIAETFDGLDLPVRQGRRERDRVCQALRVLCNGLLEDAERKSAENGVALVGDGVGMVTAVGC